MTTINYTRVDTEENDGVRTNIDAKIAGDITGFSRWMPEVETDDELLAILKDNSVMLYPEYADEIMGADYEKVDELG